MYFKGATQFKSFTLKYVQVYICSSIWLDSWLLQWDYSAHFVLVVGPDVLSFCVCNSLVNSLVFFPYSCVLLVATYFFENPYNKWQRYMYFHHTYFHNKHKCTILLNNGVPHGPINKFFVFIIFQSGKDAQRQQHFLFLLRVLRLFRLNFVFHLLTQNFYLFTFSTFTKSFERKSRIRSSKRQVYYVSPFKHIFICAQRESRYISSFL